MSLWNELATNIGQELLDIADKSPIVAIKSLRVGDFQGLLKLLAFKLIAYNDSMSLIFNVFRSL